MVFLDLKDSLSRFLPRCEAVCTAGDLNPSRRALRAKLNGKGMNMDEQKEKRYSPAPVVSCEPGVQLFVIYDRFRSSDVSS